jgi:hypothetical protein
MGCRAINNNNNKNNNNNNLSINNIRKGNVQIYVLSVYNIAVLFALNLLLRSTALTVP